MSSGDTLKATEGKAAAACSQRSVSSVCQTGGVRRQSAISVYRSSPVGLLFPPVLFRIISVTTSGLERTLFKKAIFVFPLNVPLVKVKRVFVVFA